MRKYVVFIVTGLVLFLLSGCGMALLPVSVEGSRSLDGYKYFYMNGTGSMTSRSNVGVNVGYGVYVTDPDRSINPGDFISGYLMNKGYIRVAERPFVHPGETFIVNYGEGGKRYKYNRNDGTRPIVDTYAQEVILQFISAETNDVICTIKGEGIGSTQADDIRNALQRSLDAYFEVESDDKEIK